VGPALSRELAAVTAGDAELSGADGGGGGGGGDDDDDDDAPDTPEPASRGACRPPRSAPRERGSAA